MAEETCIIVNGESHPWSEKLSILSLIEELGLGGRRVAVEVNGHIVPRSQHAQHALAVDDRIEVVQAIGGG